MKTILTLALAMFASAALHSASVTWTNTSGGLWSIPANWSPNSLPEGGDDVFITTAGSYVVTQDVHVTVGSLTIDGPAGTQTLTNAFANLVINGPSTISVNGVLGFSGGLLGGTGSLTVGGDVLWTGGTIAGALIVDIQGALTVGGAGAKALAGDGTLINHGLITWSGPSDIQTGNSARIINQAGGLIDIQNNQSLYMSNGGAITNLGTLRKSAGGGNTVFSVPLYNSGAIDVQSGSLTHAAGSQFNDGTSFTGAGTNLFSNGVVTFYGDISSENLEIGGGAIAGNSVFTGIVNWTGGNLSSGWLMIAADGALNIGGSATKYIAGDGTLINYGLITWSGPSDIQTGNSARIINQAGGLIDIQNNQSLFMSNGGAITNLGTLRKSAGGGNTVFSVPLYNSGAIDVQSGSLTHAAGSQFNDGTSFTGAGTNLVSNGVVTFYGDISSENLEIGGGAIAGNSVFTGIVNWTGGNLSSGSLMIAADGALNIGGSATKYIAGDGTLINHGLITWSGPSDIQTGNSARLINQAGGLIDIQNNQSLYMSNGGAITNLGTLRKSAGGGNTVFSVPLYNSGAIDVQSGSLTHAAGSQFNDGTSFTGAGTNLFSNGVVTFYGDISSENLEIGGGAIAGNSVFTGIVNWTGGNLSSGWLMIAADGALNIGGSATKYIAGDGTLINHGLITWSGPSDIQTGNSARIINQPGGLIDIQNNQSLFISNGGAITNLGTLRKSAGGGNTVISVPLFNSGILDVRSGLVAYGSGSQFDDGTAFTGAGTNLVYAGTATFYGDISSENLEIGGGAIAGNSVFTGIVNWASGDQAGASAMTVAPNGTLNITGSTKINLSGAVTNYGVVVWSGTNDLETFGSARISNQPGALFDIQNNQSLLIWNGGVIHNAGTLRKSAGDENSIIRVPFTNSGTVDVQHGALTFGNFTSADGKFVFALNSLARFGRIAFTQGAAFSGTLGVTLNAGYVPVAGDAFALITYPSSSGAFAGFDLPDTHAWQTNASIYGANTLTLTVLNSRPQLLPVADRDADEQVPLSFSVTGSDPDAGQSLSYALLQAPDGAAIRTDTGVFTWTPGEAQGPSTNLVTVQVSDNGAPLLSQTQQATIRIREVNRAPVPAPLSLAPINELVPFVLAVDLALDPDLPPNTLTFALIDRPPGMTIDQNTGAITWTPTEAQGPSVHAIAVRIADNGSPALVVTNTFTLSVLEVNSPPALAPLANCTHVMGAMCWITNSASDSDLPAQSLTYSLADAPPGMTIVPASGRIEWAPPPASNPLSSTVTVRVADNGVPALASEQSFVATLISTPGLHISKAGPVLVVLSWPVEATAAGFVLQSTTSLFAPEYWVNVPGTPEVAAGENLLTNGVTSALRAYRLSATLTPVPGSTSP